MVLEAVGHFGGVGPLAHLSHSPYTIGGFEAHGLAAILGALLLRNAANDDLRPWHVSALAIHLLLGGANLAFWLSFTTFGMVPMGIVTTVVHAVLVVAHAVCIAGCDGRLREHWGVNPYIVKAPPEGAGFDTTLTDGLRIAVRDVIADATVPRPTRQFAT